MREAGDELIDLNNPEQKVLTEILEMNIERIERNTKGMYVFYPFVEKRSRQEPKIIMINPAISFGRPVISGTGIPTAVIASRFHARDSIRDLAEELWADGKRSGRSDQVGIQSPRGVTLSFCF